jgi:hypothetical protein
MPNELVITINGMSGGTGDLPPVLPVARSGSPGIPAGATRILSG